VIGFEYLDILRRKAMEKAVAKEIKKVNKRRRKKCKPNEQQNWVL
jgi:hypothetical protein